MMYEICKICGGHYEFSGPFCSRECEEQHHYAEGSAHAEAEIALESEIPVREEEDDIPF